MSNTSFAYLLNTRNTITSDNNVATDAPVTPATGIKIAFANKLKIAQLAVEINTSLSILYGVHT